MWEGRLTCAHGCGAISPNGSLPTADRASQKWWKKRKRVDHIPADSVLDAYILEANYIKKFEPPYNVVDKDNKSFQFVGITREKFPRVLSVRGKKSGTGDSRG